MARNPDRPTVANLRATRLLLCAGCGELWAGPGPYCLTCAEVANQERLEAMAETVRQRKLAKEATRDAQEARRGPNR